MTSMPSVELTTEVMGTNCSLLEPEGVLRLQVFEPRCPTDRGCMIYWMSV